MSYRKSNFIPPPEPLRERSGTLESPGRSNQKLKKSGLVLVLFLIMMGWVTVYAFCAYKETYTSKAKVLVRDSAITNRYVENTTDSEVPRTTSASNSNPVLNMMELLYSNAISQRMYRYMRLSHPNVLRDLKIQTIKDWQAFYRDGESLIKAKNKAGTDVISIGFNWPDPKLAQQGMQVLLQAFRDISLDLNRQEQHERVQYLQRQMKELAIKLDGIRQEKRALKSSLNSLDFREQERAMERNRLDLNQQLGVTRSQASAKQAEYMRYRSMLGLDSKSAIRASSVGLNKRLVTLKQSLATLEQQYAHDSKLYVANNPRMIALRSEIHQVKNDIAAEMKNSLFSTGQKGSEGLISDEATAELAGKMAAAEAEGASYSAQAEKLNLMMTELEQKMRQAPAQEYDLETREEDEESLSRSVESLRQRTIEAQLQEAQTLSNIFIVDDASRPVKADFPRTHEVLILGGLLSLFSAWGLVYLWERFYESQRSKPMAEDMNHLRDSSLVKEGFYSDDDLVSSNTVPMREG